MFLKDDLITKTNLFRINEVFTKTISTPVGSILMQYGKNKISDTTYKLKFQYKFLAGSVSYRREEVTKGKFIYDNIDSYESASEFIQNDMFIDSDSVFLLKIVYLIDKESAKLKTDDKNTSKDNVDSPDDSNSQDNAGASGDFNMMGDLSNDKSNKDDTGPANQDNIGNPTDNKDSDNKSNSPNDNKSNKDTSKNKVDKPDTNSNSKPAQKEDDDNGSINGLF